MQSFFNLLFFSIFRKTFIFAVFRSDPQKSEHFYDDDDEEEEEILGSDDDEQEDPKDYCKGRLVFRSDPKIRV